MEYDFANKKLKKLCESEKELQIKFGNRTAREILARLAEFTAAENLSDIGKIPQARLHGLSGNYSGHFSVDAAHPQRIIFFPTGEYDRSRIQTITSISIITIEDYH